MAEGRSSPTINGRLGERAPEEKEHEDTVSVLLLSSGRLGHRRKHEGHNCIYGSLERREAEHQRFRNEEKNHMLWWIYRNI